MKHHNGRPPALDRLLEQFSRISVPPDVERPIGARSPEVCRQPEATPARIPRPDRFRRRLIPLSVAAGIAALVLAALVVPMNSHDAWAQVTKTLRSKPWMCMTLQIPTGAPVPEGFQPPQTW